MFPYRRPMRTTPVAAAALTLGLLAGAATGATAAALITGKDIKNGTVTTRDVRDGSLSAKDLRAGVLPDEGTYYTWRVSHDGGGSQTAWTSKATIPARARVEGVSVSFQGAGYADCVEPGYTLYAGADSMSRGGLYETGWSVQHGTVLMSTSGPMKFMPSCNVDGQTPPAFDATITFLVTERDPSSVVAFQ